MAARAYILIEAEVGRANQVVEALRSIEGVKFADVITGIHDLIACVEADTMSGVAELVTGQVQGIRGVVKTITCVAAG
ncbi:MAG TPA: Lrp/AsnC ligand binding domain-containing protein [Dehalococcoidia bacterium]|nr:Lrp/AsnC ligand binding domain-containing protein [Dehalococcoidia bacterium]